MPMSSCSFQTYFPKLIHFICNNISLCKTKDLCQSLCKLILSSVPEYYGYTQFHILSPLIVFCKTFFNHYLLFHMHVCCLPMHALLLISCNWHVTTCIAHEDEKQHLLQLDNEHTLSLSVVSEGSSSLVTDLNTVSVNLYNLLLRSRATYYLPRHYISYESLNTESDEHTPKYILYTHTYTCFCLLLYSYIYNRRAVKYTSIGKQ